MYRGIPGECDHSQTGVESPYLWLQRGTQGPGGWMEDWRRFFAEKAGPPSLLNKVKVFPDQFLQGDKNIFTEIVKQITFVIVTSGTEIRHGETV